MALPSSSLFKGLVARALNVLNPDSQNSDVALRLWSYGEMATMPLVRKAHNLAQEGSYFVASSGTGIVPTYGTSQVATSPFITIYNGNTGLQRVCIDYVGLTAIAAGASTTTAGYTALAAVIDTGNRYVSGGTQLGAAVNPDLANVGSSGVTINVGAIVASAATASARTIVSLRNLRPALSATVVNVVGDMNLLNFGGVEGSASGQISITAGVANIIPQNLPPISIPPNSTALLYLWYPVMTAPSAATYAPEVGLWVR